jgi:hypothetical protein
LKIKKNFRTRSARAVRKECCHLDNGQIAELLSREADECSGHLRQAFRRAARHAFLWEAEVDELVRSEKPLIQLDGIGPFLAGRIMDWVKKPPLPISPPPIRAEFLTLTRARHLLAEQSGGSGAPRGVLHTHTIWSDGSATVAETAQAAKERGYQYLSITDHTKGLKIANGLNEDRLLQQGREIDFANAAFGPEFKILKSAEVNLSISGEVDMEPVALKKLDLVIGSFHSALRRSEDQTNRYVAAAIRNS